MSDPNTVFRVGDRVVRRGTGALATVRAFREAPSTSTNELRVMWDDGDDDPTWRHSAAFELVSAGGVAGAAIRCAGEDGDGPPVFRREALLSRAG